VNNPLISLITVTYNAADTIEKCILSVISQRFKNLQYIIIDGQSTDGTLTIIDKYRDLIDIVISEPDDGLYDAMNKGVVHATGDIIGMLNADDYFAHDNILEEVARGFKLSGADVVYGDIDYINKEGKIVRKWRSGDYRPGCFNWGWMPPHPSFYVRRECFARYGLYNLKFGTATDYELMLRFIHTNNTSVYYLRDVMVKMLLGGVSNKQFSSRLKAWQNDYRAMRTNKLLFPLFSVVLKPLRKIFQFIP
jgi:glycosyltransferase involved in cell wall biosynthesis